MRSHCSLTLAPASALPLSGAVDECKAHYRTAERIHANAAWQTQVRNIAGVVGAQDVPYSELVHRAREILVKGPTYEVTRGGRTITYGASLIDEGGYIELLSAAGGDAGDGGAP